MDLVFAPRQFGASGGVWKIRITRIKTNYADLPPPDASGLRVEFENKKNKINKKVVICIERSIY